MIRLPPLMRQWMFYFSYFIDSPTLLAMSTSNPRPNSPSNNLPSSVTLVHPPSCLVVTLTCSPSEHLRVLEINWALLPPPNWNGSLLDSKKLVSHSRAACFWKFNLHWHMGRRKASKKEVSGGSGLTPPSWLRAFQSTTPHLKSDMIKEWGISWWQLTQRNEVVRQTICFQFTSLSSRRGIAAWATLLWYRQGKCIAKSQSTFYSCFLTEYRKNSGILRTLKNTSIILAPEGLQNISGKQRHPIDVVYPSARGQTKSKAKPKQEGKTGGHAII